MHWPIIEKLQATDEPLPNFKDYDQVCSRFSWEAVLQELDGLPDGQGLNIAYEAVDRHALGPRRDHLALRWLGRSGEVCDFTYGQLREFSNRFANVLKELGVGKGDRRKVTGIRDSLAKLEHVLLVRSGGQKNTEVAGPWDFQTLLDAASPEFEIPPTDPEILAAYERAYALCRQMGQTPKMIPALNNLMRYYICIGQTQRADELSREAYRLLQQFTDIDPAWIAVVDHCMGYMAWMMGDFATARRFMQQGVEHSDSRYRETQILVFGEDMGIRSQVFFDYFFISAAKIHIESLSVSGINSWHSD